MWDAFEAAIDAKDMLNDEYEIHSSDEEASYYYEEEEDCDEYFEIVDAIQEVFPNASEDLIRFHLDNSNSVSYVLKELRSRYWECKPSKKADSILREVLENEKQERGRDAPGLDEDDSDEDPDLIMDMIRSQREEKDGIVASLLESYPDAGQLLEEILETVNWDINKATSCLNEMYPEVYRQKVEALFPKVQYTAKAPSFKPVSRGLVTHSCTKETKRRATCSSQIDLHGMSRSEAEKAVKSYLTKAKMAGLKCVSIITGQGIHSKNTVPVLRPCVLRACRNMGVEAVIGANLGIVTCYLK